MPDALPLLFLKQFDFIQNSEISQKRIIVTCLDHTARTYRQSTRGKEGEILLSTTHPSIERTNFKGRIVTTVYQIIFMSEQFILRVAGITDHESFKTSHFQW